MKRVRNKIHVWLLMLVACCSCEDWLEVDSSTNVTQEQLFRDGEGFRTAVNGLYYYIGQYSLYGRELTWGLASVLGQNYDVEHVYTRYWDLAAGTYESSRSYDVTDPIWSAAFTVVANCNNLLQQLETKDTTFFQCGKVERDLIQGEALGMRALMHFEMLRLYAPAPIADDGGVYLPYVETYPEHFPIKQSSSYVLDKVIEDLTKAKQLLAYHDTAYNAKAFQNVYYRIHATGTVEGGLFFNGRATRMNYFAASALLARAYLWKGDKENALKNAEDVYAYGPDGLGWFTFTAEANMADASTDEVHRKMYEDILFAAVNQLEYDLWDDDQSVEVYYPLKNTEALFDGDEDDWRLTVLIGTDGSSLRWAEPEASSTKAQEVIDYQGPLAPVIRMSEVYHIMCECLADVDLSRATSILSSLRLARGAKVPLTVSTQEDLLEVLYKDIIRETLSEGGSFYMHKRLDRDIYDGENEPVDMTGRWVLPVPESEFDIY